MVKTDKTKRVIFYSKEDMAGSSKLRIAESILQNFDSNKKFDVNDIIELYQIKQYFDNDLYLTDWSNETINNYKEVVERMWGEVRKYWLCINDSNVAELYKQVEFEFRRDFWSLTEQLQHFKQIQPETFSGLINSDNFWIRNVLQQKRMVKYFSTTLKEYLLDYNKSAELLLSQFEEEHTGRYKDLFFPKSLTNDDKENIFYNYLENPEANLNNVRLIVKARAIKISPEIRLKATKVAKVMNDEILRSGYVWDTGNKIILSGTQKEPVKKVWKGNTQEITYSTSWLDSITDNYDLFQNFSLLFDYTDSFGNIELVSKSIEMDEFERILMRSKNDYEIGYSFNRKSNLSHLQLITYDYYLQQRDRSVEGLLAYMIQDYIKGKYGISNLKFSFPTKTATNLEKIRMLVPEMESFLKQFKLYSTKGVIDHELLQISSIPLRVGDIPSLVLKKYVYGIGDEFLKLKHHFFSSQSMLWYIKDLNEKKYQNLYSLLINEDVKMEDFGDYQQTTIKQLIDDGYLKVTPNNSVEIATNDLLFLIGMLNKNEVVSYWVFPKEVRMVIDSMAVDGFVRYGNTLFSEPEQKYFNYYLNKSEFTNGLDLRNRYVHGTNSDTDEEHRNYYYVVLKLLVLIVLKIENDLHLGESCN